MDNKYKHAAGRNWEHGGRKRRPVKLGRDAEAGELARTPSPVWYSLEDYRLAAGRNWTREPRKTAGAHLDSGDPSARAQVYPWRERGGGDRDVPYEYRRPSWRWTFPFTTRQYARLLAFKSRRSAARDEAEGSSASALGLVKE